MGVTVCVESKHVESLIAKRGTRLHGGRRVDRHRHHGLSGVAGEKIEIAEV